MTPVRILGACGLVSSALVAIAGGFQEPLLLAAGLVMFVGNTYAIFRKDRA